MSAAGLFGPDSVTWRVHREPIVTVGGLRSLYLQALLPRAVAGVEQNSRYRKDPWGRFQHTATYVATVIYGTTEQAERAGQRVRSIHARMTATDPRTGERFRVDDPHLLRWVHVTEVESFMEAALAIGLMPAWARRLYGLPGLPATDLIASANALVLGRVLSAIPIEWISPLRHNAVRRIAESDAAAGTTA